MEGPTTAVEAGGLHPDDAFVESQRAIADELRYQRLLDAIEEGVVEATADGEFITVNRAFAAMLGYSSAEDLMSRVANAVELYPTARQRMLRVQRLYNQSASATEIELVTKSGGSMWIRSRSTVRRSPTGEVLSHQAICEDITASRQARRQLSAIVDGSNDAIIGTTLDGIITSWNSAAERLFGFAAEEILSLIHI